MDVPALNPLLDSPPRCVLVVVDDQTLAELLAEALLDAGHVPQMAENNEVLDGEVDCALFSAAIVDLDSRSNGGSTVVARIRRDAPSTTIIALLPCGGQASDFKSVHYHLAIEKPARLKTLLAAVSASRLDAR